jgi:predicted nucleotidyltransferase
MTGVKIKIQPEEIETFCKRYQVQRMSLFGSVLRDDFKVESDVDVLVQFDAEARASFMTLGKMQRELAAIFQRPVDLVPQDGLKHAIRDQLLSTAMEVYAA